MRSLRKESRGEMDIHVSEAYQSYQCVAVQLAVLVLVMLVYKVAARPGCTFGNRKDCRAH